ncbi:MAG: hypothetical protein ACRD4V_01430 [Candidatus Acidiferrales bacterium]
MDRRSPIEHIIGGGKQPGPDALGTFLGWSIFALGVFIVFSAYKLYASHRFLSDLAPYEAGLGLILAICGFGLARRYAFGLWLAGAWVLALVTLVLWDLRDPAGVEWWPALLTISLSIGIFVYFLSQRQEFKRKR